MIMIKSKCNSFSFFFFLITLQKILKFGFHGRRMSEDIDFSCISVQ